MRAASFSGRPFGGNGAAFLPRLRFVVERMHITAKGRTWHQVDLPHDTAAQAGEVARGITRREALTVRVRPVIL